MVLALPLPTTSDLRAMLRLALPVAAVQLGIMAMGVTDTIMVGHLSPAALAAAALGNLYFFIAGIFGQGTLMALDPVISQAVGARDEEAISRALQRGLVVALALTVFTCATFVPVEWVLRVLRQPPEVIPNAASYVRIAIPGVFPFYAFVVFRQSLQAMHRVAPVLWTVLLANLLNAGLNWVFIYGNLGSPALGVAGSSLATSVSRWAMALAVMSIAGQQVWHHLTPWRPETLAIEPLKRMLRLGLPIGVQYLLEYGAFAAAALLMGVLGTTQMAAHQIAINLASFTFMVPLGVSTATAVLVGHAIGAGDEDAGETVGDCRHLRRSLVHVRERARVPRLPRCPRPIVHGRRRRHPPGRPADSDRRGVSGLRWHSGRGGRGAARDR